jgi:2'-5' RNA ligase
MRLFVAISLSGQVREIIWKKIKQLKKEFPKVSWIKPDNIHLTLKFLGNVEENKLPEIKKAIAESIKNIHSFDLKFTDFGYFDKGYLVIWLGIEPVRELLSLVKNVEKETKKLGILGEKRAYSPHITLGRGKHLVKEEAVRLMDKVRILPSPNIESLPISEITLMQSILSPAGAIYQSQGKFALCKEEVV